MTVALIGLMKGVVDRDASPNVWQGLLSYQARVRDYVAALGLELRLDEAEGYAYLRQRLQADDETELPRLIPRRQLSYATSLLLALLRKKLAEFDASSGEARLVVTRAHIVDMMRLFLPESVNEAKLQERIEQDIRRVADMGFLRPLKDAREGAYEVRRILKAFVDAQWLNDFSNRLAAYAAHGRAMRGEAESADG